MDPEGKKSVGRRDWRFGSTEYSYVSAVGCSTVQAKGVGIIWIPYVPITTADQILLLREEDRQ